jgi:hypothetical protein
VVALSQDSFYKELNSDEIVLANKVRILLVYIEF